jgi:hypothetical protein
MLSNYKICSERLCLRVIILDPDSNLLECHQEPECKKTYAEMAGKVHRVFNALDKELDKYIKEHQIEKSITSGSIEVRTHKNIFSPVFYYSGNNLNIVGLHFSLGRNNEYPGFDLIDPKMKDTLDKHFEDIWNKSFARTILRWNVGKYGTTINQVMEKFPDSSLHKHIDLTR